MSAKTTEMSQITVKFSPSKMNNEEAGNTTTFITTVVSFMGVLAGVNIMASAFTANAVLLGYVIAPLSIIAAIAVGIFVFRYISSIFDKGREKARVSDSIKLGNIMAENGYILHPLSIGSSFDKIVSGLFMKSDTCETFRSVGGSFDGENLTMTLVKED